MGQVLLTHLASALGCARRLASLSAVSPCNILHAQGRHDTDSFVRQEILEQGTWLVVTIWLEHSLILFVSCNAFEVVVEEVRRIKRSSTSFWVEPIHCLSALELDMAENNDEDLLR